jgi:hypothetical protein
MIENVSQHNIFRFEFHGYYGTVLTGMEICKYNMFVTFASAISIIPLYTRKYDKYMWFRFMFIYFWIGKEISIKLGRRMIIPTNELVTGDMSEQPIG